MEPFHGGGRHNLEISQSWESPIVKVNFILTSVSGVDISILYFCRFSIICRRSSKLSSNEFSFNLYSNTLSTVTGILSRVNFQSDFQNYSYCTFWNIYIYIFIPYKSENLRDWWIDILEYHFRIRHKDWSKAKGKVKSKVGSRKNIKVDAEMDLYSEWPSNPSLNFWTSVAGWSILGNPVRVNRLTGKLIYSLDIITLEFVLFYGLILIKWWVGLPQPTLFKWYID